MRFLSTILQHRDVYIAAGTAIILVALWIWSRYARHRYVVIRASEPVQMISVQLGRIADAIDHLAASIEAKSATAQEENEKHVSMSMLGR